MTAIIYIKGTEPIKIDNWQGWQLLAANKLYGFYNDRQDFKCYVNVDDFIACDLIEDE